MTKAKFHEFLMEKTDDEFGNTVSLFLLACASVASSTARYLPNEPPPCDRKPWPTDVGKLWKRGAWEIAEPVTGWRVECRRSLRRRDCWVIPQAGPGQLEAPQSLCCPCNVHSLAFSTSRSCSKDTAFRQKCGVETI